MENQNVMVEKPGPTAEEQNEALRILVQGLKLACKRGAFELEEAGVLAEKMKVFSVPKEDILPKTDDKGDEENPENVD